MLCKQSCTTTVVHFLLRFCCGFLYTYEIITKQFSCRRMEIRKTVRFLVKILICRENTSVLWLRERIYASQGDTHTCVHCLIDSMRWWIFTIFFMIVLNCVRLFAKICLNDCSPVWTFGAGFSAEMGWFWWVYTVEHATLDDLSVLLIFIVLKNVKLHNDMSTNYKPSDFFSTRPVV